MSAKFEVQWENTIANLRRRLQAGGKVIALGAFMSARKEALPILEKMNVTPADVTAQTMSDALSHVTRETCGTAIRCGLTKKYLTALLEEVGKEPVTDEEVEAGIKKGEAEHEAAVAARRAVREGEKRAAPPRGADDGGHDAGDEAGDGGGSAAAGADGQPDADADEGAEEEEEEEGEAPAPSPPTHSTANRTPARRVTNFERAHRGAEAQGRRAQQHHHEDEMNRDEDENDDQYEGQHDDEGDEGTDEQPPPPKRTRARAQQPQVIVVPQQPRVKAPRAAAPAPRSKFLPRNNDMVRIYKRIGGGRRSVIGEYTSEDIGPNVSLLTFLKEYIDPENSEPNGRTTYECVAVDGRGEEVGRPATYTIESQPQEGANNGPIGQMREALDLINELRGDEEERNRKTSDLLQQAKEKALSGGEVNFGNMMMLMFMEKMNQPRHDPEAIARMVLERVAPHTPPPMPMMMPPPLPPPQPAPQQSSVVDKLLEVSIAQMVKPEPPAPSPLQQLREFVELQKLMKEMGGGGGDMAALVKTLIEKQLTAPAKPPEVAGVDQMMLSFEKLSTMVKALAPQINAGGIAGTIQGILAQPEAQKALAGVLGQLTGQPVPGAQQPQLPPGVPQQNVAQAPQPQQQPPQQPQQPQPTREMQDAAAALRIAQTKEVRVERLKGLLQAMYLGGYGNVMEPILVEARKGNIQPAQRFLATLLADVSPSLVSLELVNATLRDMAKMDGENGKAMVAALDAAEKGTAKPAEKPAGTVETPNATVVPIASAQAHPHHDAYMQQVAALEAAEKEKKTKSVAPAANPHAPEVEVKPKKEEPAPAAEPAPAQAAAPSPPAPPAPPVQTPPAEVVTFEKPPVEQPQPTAS